MNDLPVPISSTHYKEISTQDLSTSDQEEESEENFDTYSDPDPEDAHFVHNIDSEFDDDVNDEDADPENDNDYSEFLWNINFCFLTFMLMFAICYVISTLVMYI